MGANITAAQHMEILCKSTVATWIVGYFDDIARATHSVDWNVIRFDRLLFTIERK